MFLTICDNIIEQFSNDTDSRHMTLEESFGGKYPEETFDELYERMMRENCRSTFRVDRTGQKISVPYGATFKIGENGKGVAIPKGWTWQQDDVGQIHAIEPGYRLKIGLDGKGVLVCN